MDLPIKMVIFHSYVSLPEGSACRDRDSIRKMIEMRVLSHEHWDLACNFWQPQERWISD